MKKSLYEKFGPHVGNELLLLVLGRKIGAGQTRTVYEAAFDKRKVVKIERDGQSFANANEIQIWSRLKDTPLGKWLAPVVLFSPYARAIVQPRCIPVKPKELPDAIPAFLNRDLKPENWAYYPAGRRIVCIDYGHLDVFDNFAEGDAAKLVKPVFLA